ncbi:MAG: hypothetical protein IKJ74_01865 [Clostridia bacterium]|nr:hypothetical protein [Clostridia bacterium]
MKPKPILQNVIRTVISLFLLLIFASSLTLSVLTPLGKSALSAENIKKRLEEIHYTQGVREDISRAFEPLCVTSGIPKELADSFLNEAVSDEALIQPILQMYTAETLSLPTEEWKKDFSARVESYATTLRKEEVLELTDEEFETLKASFPETAEYFISEISSSIRLSGLFSVLGSAIGMVERLTPYLFTASIAFALFSGLLLVLIWKKKVFCFAYAGFVSAGILFLIPALLNRATNYVARLSIEPAHLKQLICSVSDGFCQNLLAAGIALCIVGVLFGFFALISSRKQLTQKE